MKYQLQRQLRRNKHNRVIAGVCAGLADHLSMDVSWIRIFFVLAMLAGCSGALLYAIMWMIVPANNHSANQNGPLPTNDHEAAIQPLTAPQYPRPSDNSSRNAGATTGIVLIMLGVLFLLERFDLLPEWFEWRTVWPMALIIPGVVILVRALIAKKPHNKPSSPNPLS